MSNVLIVEESQKLSGLIAKFLNKKGITADIAHDGPGAMRLFAAGTYDLLLVNRELPMMNGDVFCKKLRETPQGMDVPIIMMSGYLKEQTDITVLIRDLRLQGFLTKPFTSDILFSLVSSSLGTAAVPQAPPINRPAPQGPQKVKGSLERVPFAQVLYYLFRKKATGVLTVSRDAVKRIYFLIDGAVADLDVAPDDRDFGDYLAGKKLAETAELREYKDRRTHEGADIRDLFVKMGCLTPGQFQKESADFLRERLLETFTWKTGSVYFEPAASALSTFPSAAVSMPGLFFRAFHGGECADAIRSFMKKQGTSFPVRTPEFFAYQNHLAAEAPLAEALDLCDGRMTCAEILGSVDAEEAGVLLYTLHYLKALTFSESPLSAAVPPPFPLRERAQNPVVREAEKFEDLRGELNELADEVGTFDPGRSAQAPQSQALSSLEEDLKQRWDSIKDKDYYEMFGLKQSSFSFEKLKNAYFELTRAYGPEKFFASSSEVMSLAEEMLSKISNAYETLTNVVSKENYDELLASQERMPEGTDDKQFYEQIQFQSGKVFVEQGQYESAEKAFTNCVTINPDKAEYLAYLALAIYHNPAHRGNPGVIKRAKETVNKSLQRGKLSIAHALKGTIYLDEGGMNFAEAEFNKALRLNPSNKTALKKLELIKAKREEEKKGLFQRMFT